MRIKSYILRYSYVFLILFLTGNSFAFAIPGTKDNTITFPGLSADSLTKGDTINLRYPFNDESTLPGSPGSSNLYLKNPPNVQSTVEYDPVTHQYVRVYKIGGRTYRIPETMTFEEYQEEDNQEMLQKYWKERAEAASMDNKTGVIPKLHIGGKVFETIFGNNTVDIRPQGSAEITFGLISNRRDDPMLNTTLRRQTNFDFNEKIQMNVIAKIGDKIEFKTSYNTEATFDFENKLKLKYDGKEDDIVQSIEAGDVDLPLNSTLIKGSESLFGIKAKLRFGRLTVTALYSQQKSETKNITLQGNAQTTKFSIPANSYESDRHFFVAQAFRSKYKAALKALPVIGSSVNIVRMEVWVTNIGAAVTDNRNIIAFQDLGENDPYNKLRFQSTYGKTNPSNKSNNLIQVIMPRPADSVYVRNINKVSNYLGQFNLISGIDYEKVESARKLLPTEYSFNSKLGFISLNTTLNPGQVLAVAYQYQIIGDTTVYQVGEFANQGINAPSCLIVKLLRSSELNTRIPLWNLMMKNVYNLNAYQVQSQNFILNILYSGNKNGVPTAYITESRISGSPLLRVMGFDNLDQQLNPPSDGLFDFIDGAATGGGTIQASNGRIFFPSLEPFGADLRDSIYDPNDPQNSLNLANKYCFDSLYTVTPTTAKQYTDKNKFTISGSFKSSVGSEISLNALNVPQGSVKVTAGGVPLVENVDYTVDYTLGRVRIINEGILNSGTPINISLESNQMYNIQTKRLMGAHFDYKFNKDFMIGGTILNLNEQPLTQKVNYGDEPISNTMWGINLTYRTESRLITRLVNMLPFIHTKAVSKIAVDGEFAQFIPGHSKTIGSAGTSYIDDFEGASSTIDLTNVGTWFLASTPQFQTNPSMFPEAAPGTGLAYGFNRAKLSWYIIDPLFYDKNENLLPPNITNTELSKNAVRQVWQTEVFPNEQPLNGVPVNQAVLNLAYYPSDRGPYNYDVRPSAYSKGVASDGTLNAPETRWGGMMCAMPSTDFDAANIQYIEFWMMDPFTSDSTINGDLYFNLGDVSEDILRDGMKAFENGLPISSVVTNVDTTIWGRVPSIQALVNAFDNTPGSRQYQDVGYDGLSDADERTFFDTTYLKKIASLYGVNSQAYQLALKDPSSDDFHYFRGTDYDNESQYSSILERYKNYTGVEGNSPASDNSPEKYPTMSTTLPNVEDINNDNTLSENEGYYQYVVHLNPGKMRVGENYITDMYHATDIPLANGSKGNVRWYQFKIPIRTPDKTVGNIQGFTSIRFMRMFFKGFNKNVVCRFATLDLSRGEWLAYQYDLLQPGEYIPTNAQNKTDFEVSTVSIEQNGSKQPIPYVMPPGIQRETNWGSTNQQQLNEQSMDLKVVNLVDGDSRAVFKTCQFDFRQFKRLQMFVHAEQSISNQNVKTGDLTIFMRVGSDLTLNYYEYEIPLHFTPWYTSSTNPGAIWPDANAFDINLAELVQVKENRNLAMRATGSTVTTSTPFVENDGNNRITVVGSPSISDVESIMIGIRNPKKTSQSTDDDGLPKSAEIWVDELRLTDFNKSGGWAATARIAADIADLGRVQLTGSYTSDGFGSLEDKQTQRSLEATAGFGFITDLELGKFFPEKSGIRIPMHFDYSLIESTPEYDPLNPDVLYKDVLNSYATKKQKDSIRAISEEYTQRKNFNLMNVRKDRKKDKKPKIYDIENFNISYSYSEVFQRNPDIAYDLQKKYAGGLGYNYSIIPKSFMPFSKMKALTRHKAYRLITDFNLNYLPRSFSFRTDMNRQFEEEQFRNKSTYDIPMITNYIKSWTWARVYDLKYDFSKSLKLSLVANANAFVNEPPGLIDHSNEKQVWNQIFAFGTMNNYNQQFSGTYDVPFSKIPYFEWISVTAGYQASYHWTGSPVSLQSEIGNTIENSATKVLNGKLSFMNIYNKVPYLKKLLQSTTTSGKQNPNQSLRNTKPDKTQAKIDSLKKVTAKNNFGKFIKDETLRILTCIRSIGINYTQGAGTVIPGFTPVPNALGNNWAQNAPGLGFIFGSQKDIRPVGGPWMTRDSLQVQPYLNKYNDNLSLAASLEPLPDLKIEISALRTSTQSRQEYYRYSDTLGKFVSYSPMENGSFTMSYLMIGTSFTKNGEKAVSPLFNKMEAYRLQIAQRYSARNPWSSGKTDSTGYPVGYGSTDQEVLNTAFLAAYSGRNPAKIGLTAFPSIPFPNWRITYDGLAKIKAIKKYLRTLTISHAYTSTYSVGSYTTNIQYQEKDGYSTQFDNSGNFIPKDQIGVVSLTENFNPLIKFDMGWVNSLLSSFEWKRSRNLAFDFDNNQLTEIFTNEIIIGLGYRFKNVRLSFISLGTAGKKSNYKSDLSLKADFSIARNMTVLRQLDQTINQISTGQQVITINFTADYNLNQRFTLRFYFNKIINSPYVSNQYYTSNTKGGFTLRFTLAQ